MQHCRLVIDHSWIQPHGLHYRRVRLFADFRQWEQDLLQIWQELRVPDAPVEFSIVHPPPPARDHRIAAHVIIVQHPRAEWATTLATVTEAHRPTAIVRQKIAVTTQEHILLENLLLVLQFLASCTGTNPILSCSAHYQDAPIRFGHPFPGRNGMSIVIQIRPTPASGPVLLQLATFMQHSPSVDLSPQPCERQTTDAVAQAQWPQELQTSFDPRPAVGTCVPADWKSPEQDIWSESYIMRPPFVFEYSGFCGAQCHFLS